MPRLFQVAGWSSERPLGQECPLSLRIKHLFVTLRSCRKEVLLAGFTEFPDSVFQRYPPAGWSLGGTELSLDPTCSSTPLLTQNLHPHAVKIRPAATLGSVSSLAKKAPHEPLIAFVPFLGTKMFSYPLRGGPLLSSLLWLWALLSAAKGTDRTGAPIVGHTNTRTGWPLLGMIYAGWRGLRAEISPRHPKPCCLYPAVSPFFTLALCGKQSSKGLHVKSMCWSGRWEGGAA